MRGIKRKCRLVVVSLLKSNSVIATSIDLPTVVETFAIECESISKAEQVRQAKKGDVGQIDGKVIYSKITPLD